jgi:pyridoxamine 5'-phosphate oxidase
MSAQSRKGDEIAGNPHAAICLHWKSLGRQVRAEGTLSMVSDADADAYWASRPRASQVAAWASDQSRTLPNRAELQKRVEEADARFAGKPVPRPAHWKGYCLMPHTIEFWLNLPNRLHERLVFLRAGKEWRTERLYP